MLLRIRTAFRSRLPLTRHIHATPRVYIDPSTKQAAEETGEVLNGGGAGTKGRTAGGADLHSTAKGAPGKPKVMNFSTPGKPGEDKNLSEEQKREVEEHNREYDATHGNAGGKQREAGEGKNG